MRRRVPIRVISTVLLVGLTAGSASAAGTTTSTAVVDPTAAARGIARLHELSKNPTVPREARAGLARLLSDAAGTRVSVATPAPSLTALAPRPSGTTKRVVAAINNLTYVVDHSANFRRVTAHVLAPNGSTRLKLDVRLESNPTDPRSWIATSRTNDGKAENATFELVREVIDCAVYCVTAGIAATLITGVFCAVAVTAGSIAGTLLCIALGAVLTGGTGFTCSAIVQACDADPNRHIILMPPPQLRCMYYTACDVDGVLTSHEYGQSLSDLTAHLAFWYNPNEFAFDVFDESDLGLRQTIDYAQKKAWRYSAFLTMWQAYNIECTDTATIHMFAAFPNGATASTFSGMPKLKRPESSCGRRE